ncbi:MAG: hypothetical protein JWR19_3709 [Pedosphaera sp.]|nr:hypothetical protein [Pedosphaera sp.]
MAYASEFSKIVTIATSFDALTNTQFLIVGDLRKRSLQPDATARLNELFQAAGDMF